MDSITSFFVWPFSVEGLLSMIVILLFVVLQEIKGLRRQMETLIKLRFPEVFRDD